MLLILPGTSWLHLRRRISIRGMSVRPSVGPSVRNAFSQTTARRILRRVFGLVFCCIGYPFISFSISLDYIVHHYLCLKVLILTPGKGEMVAINPLLLAYIHACIACKLALVVQSLERQHYWN